jgi:hypothetical protein
LKLPFDLDPQLAKAQTSGSERELPEHRMKSVFVSLCAVLLLATQAAAQVVDRNARGPAGKDIQIGVYINVRPDCSSGPLPTIRLSGPPQHGKVTVKQGRVKATNYKQCLALEVPGYVALYRAPPGFSGADVLTLDIKYPNGRSETQKITVQVTAESQPI